MRGCVRKHGTGWQFTIEVGKDPVTNKRIQKSKGGFKTKKECEAEMSNLISKIEKGEYIVDKILIPNIGSILLFKLKPMQIETLLKGQGERESINGTTLRHYYNVLNIALNQAVRWRLINYNPCMAVEPPKWENVDLENKFIKIKRSNNYTKVGNNNEFSNVKTESSERIIPLLDITINELKEWKDTQDKNDYVCTWEDGSLIRPDYVSQQYSRVIKKLPITRVRFHCCQSVVKGVIYENQKKIKTPKPLSLKV